MSTVLPLAVSLAVLLLALRLVAQGLRLGKHPETILGVGFGLCAVGVALLLGTNAQGAHGTAGMRALGHQLIDVGIGALVVFAWRVFRPRQRWALWMSISCAMLLEASWVAHGVGAAWGPGNGAAHMSVNLARLLPFTWLFLESGAYYATMRRRVRIGLSDPVVANRFLLWSAWTGGLVALPLLALPLRIAGSVPTEVPAYLPASALFGLVTLGGLWLGFFPPAAYVRWVAARAT